MNIFSLSGLLAGAAAAEERALLQVRSYPCPCKVTPVILHGVVSADAPYNEATNLQPRPPPSLFAWGVYTFMTTVESALQVVCPAKPLVASQVQALQREVAEAEVEAEAARAEHQDEVCLFERGRE